MLKGWCKSNLSILPVLKWQLFPFFWLTDLRKYDLKKNFIRVDHCFYFFYYSFFSLSLSLLYQFSFFLLSSCAVTTVMVFTPLFYLILKRNFPINVFLHLINLSDFFIITKFFINQSNLYLGLMQFLILNYMTLF